jgi:hypothetical protein
MLGILLLIGGCIYCHNKNLRLLKSTEDVTKMEDSKAPPEDVTNVEIHHKTSTLVVRQPHAFHVNYVNPNEIATTIILNQSTNLSVDNVVLPSPSTTTVTTSNSDYVLVTENKLQQFIPTAVLK